MSSYKPNKIREPDVIMKLLLKDEESVYQSARCLSASDKELVNAQIDQWLVGGIVQLSTSDYASPVVLVRKRDNSVMLVIYAQIVRRL